MVNRWFAVRGSASAGSSEGVSDRLFMMAVTSYSIVLKLSLFSLSNPSAAIPAITLRIVLIILSQTPPM